MVFVSAIPFGALAFVLFGGTPAIALLVHGWTTTEGKVVGSTPQEHGRITVEYKINSTSCSLTRAGYFLKTGQTATVYVAHDQKHTAMLDHPRERLANVLLSTLIVGIAFPALLIIRVIWLRLKRYPIAENQLWGNESGEVKAGTVYATVQAKRGSTGGVGPKYRGHSPEFGVGRANAPQLDQGLVSRQAGGLGVIGQTPPLSSLPFADFSAIGYLLRQDQQSMCERAALSFTQVH